MAYHDAFPMNAYSGLVETRTSVDDLIRPALSRAFPLPTGAVAEDGRFRVLLDALAERSRAAGPSQAEPWTERAP